MDTNENNINFDTESRKPAINTSGWFDGKAINEPAFCEYFLRLHPLIFNSQSFYDVDGPVSEQRIQKEIMDLVAACIQKHVAAQVNNLMDMLKIYTPNTKIALRTDCIHLHNGTYFLDGTFTDAKLFTLNRLPVAYNPDAVSPTVWLNFLSELFYEEDIPTIQEFLGYLLIPTTRGQKMLMIIGDGGEGKSVLGCILGKMLGSNMTNTSIQKLSSNRFARADQCGKLLMLDDDMKMSALTDSDLLKSTITNMGTTDVERKGAQSTQERMYVRIIGLGNGTLSALHDRSDGFYRRMLIVRVKRRAADRIDDPFMNDRLTEELEGILLWCIEGLKRLIQNEYHFTASARAAKLLQDAQREQNNVIEFLDSTGYIRFDPKAAASSHDLFTAYAYWCKDNADDAVSLKTFSSRMRELTARFGLVYDKNLDFGNGKRVRGFHGIEVLIAGAANSV